MRDPRFDDRCGHLNQDLFSKSFEFLKDMNEREMKEMQKDMKNTKDPMKKERLQKKLKRAVSSMHIHISTYIHIYSGNCTEWSSFGHTKVAGLGDFIIQSGFYIINSIEINFGLALFIEQLISDHLTQVTQVPLYICLYIGICIFNQFNLRSPYSLSMNKVKLLTTILSCITVLLAKLF